MSDGRAVSRMEESVTFLRNAHKAAAMHVSQPRCRSPWAAAAPSRRVCDMSVCSFCTVLYYTATQMSDPFSLWRSPEL